MAEKPDHSGLLTRRTALAGLAATTLGSSLIAASIQAGAAAEGDPGPVFSPSGPDAQLYGAADGFPVPDRALALQQGNPYAPKYRVGAFSHIDEIYPTRRVARAASPWMFKRAQADFSYSYKGSHSSLTEYLARNPVSGLLIARDDEILFEHYQYGRTDHDRLVSQSMVKSITGILIGIAISEGAIKSIDDTSESYVPGFQRERVRQDADPRPASYVFGC